MSTRRAPGRASRGVLEVRPGVRGSYLEDRQQDDVRRHRRRTAHRQLSKAPRDGGDVARVLFGTVTVPKVAFGTPALSRTCLASFPSGWVCREGAPRDVLGP